MIRLNEEGYEEVKYPKKKERKKKSSNSRASQRVFTRKFNDEQVDRLRRLIQNQNDRGEERFFAIKIDGEFCVNKTSNPDYFDDYKEMIDGSTETVEVVMYFGKSNNCNRHIFYLKNGGVDGLGAIDVDRKIKDALKVRDREYELQNLKEKVESQTDYIEELETELEELREKTDFKGLLKDGMQLLGAWKGSGNASQQLSGVPEAESEVEIEAVGEEGESKPKSDLQENFEVFSEVSKHFGKDGLKQLLGLAGALATSPTLRKGVNELINQHKNSPDGNNDNPEQEK